jgi:PPOX class probable F420-dependent enzyme
MVFLSVDRILQPLRRPVFDEAPRPAAPDDPRVERRLRSEPVVWLSTTDERGFPHIVPIWYVWDGEAFLIFSKPHARKVRAVRRNSRVALALGEPRDDFDVQLVEGHATVLARRAAEVLDDPSIGREHARKYAAELFALGIDRAEYATTYSAVVRIVPTRFLPWHGRGPRWSGAPQTTPTRLIRSPLAG